MLESWFFIVLGIVFGLMIHVAYRRWRRSRLPKRRVVEAPNSTFTSSIARQLGRREKWEAIRLNTLHPLNRGEVERLLGLLTSGGFTALTERERAFLDHLADPSS